MRRRRRRLTSLGVAEGAGERVYAGGDAPAAKAGTPVEVAAPIAVEVPEWARRDAPVEARPARPLAPSSLGDDLVADPPPSADARAAAERGRLLHALFERLPGVAPDLRAAAANRWLRETGGVTDAGVRDEIARGVCAVIGDARFADLFGPESLAEAPVTAVIEGGLVVAGTVDRLLVGPGRVRVIDFKTGRRVPASLDAVPPYHLKQMAAYAAALGIIFPGRTIDAALLYTAGPTLFALPAALLAAHKPRLPATEQS